MNNYSKYRSKIKNGDILLYTSNGWRQKYVIGPLLGFKYSHVGLAIWWDEKLMVIESIAKKGVILRPLSISVDKYHGNIDLYVPKDIKTIIRDKVVIEAKKELGKEYGMKYAIQLGLKLIKEKLFGENRKEQYKDRIKDVSRSMFLFCSELVSQSYRLAGKDLCKEFVDDYTIPDDIANSDKVTFKVKLK